MQQNVYTVSQVNSYIKNMFAQDYMLNSVLVKGEVSNCKYHSSGHIYFTLKDASGVIACVMFASSRTGLKFRMEEGMQVIVGGSIAVFERDGKYQLYAKKITADGEGDLYLKFEQLKKELSEQGMFDPCYKQPIPQFVRKLGVVTAPTGAAVQDIINISKRRNPYIQIILYPAIVQGELAADSIVAGIHALEKEGVDVMIVGRGGGSIEDLWAFNEEKVAKAVFDCSIPIISAVGHETDTTIIDFVSDLRAPTPSAAAELAVFELAALDERFNDAYNRLVREMDLVIKRERRKVENGISRLNAVSPQSKIREKRTYLIKLEDNLSSGMERVLRNRRHRLDIFIEKMNGLSPINKMSTGFAYVSDGSGKMVKDVKSVNKGDKLNLRLVNGIVHTTVDSTEEASF
ncbi:MAG: exodeoxyribonuclease VII large subunit [Lachnospiraceae bacterium]|jgi:exodeoxyribonuclease VII large subunit|nr:exodeoxyribonuclease VII large subunit [Lachnospiraceae bacterium]